MENIRIEELPTFSGIETFVFIEREDGSQLSMPKAVWDQQQKAAELGGTL